VPPKRHSHANRGHMAKFKYNARVLTKCIRRRGPTSGRVGRYTCAVSISWPAYVAAPPPPMSVPVPPLPFSLRSTDFSVCFSISLSPFVIRQCRYTYRGMSCTHSLQGCFKIHPTENAQSSLSLPRFLLSALPPSLGMLLQLLMIALDHARGI